MVNIPLSIGVLYIPAGCSPDFWTINSINAHDFDDFMGLCQEGGHKVRLWTNHVLVAFWDSLINGIGRCRTLFLKKKLDQWLNDQSPWKQTLIVSFLKKWSLEFWFIFLWSMASLQGFPGLVTEECSEIQGMFSIRRVLGEGTFGPFVWTDEFSPCFFFQKSKSMVETSGFFTSK